MLRTHTKWLVVAWAFAAAAAGAISKKPWLPPGEKAPVRIAAAEGASNAIQDIWLDDAGIWLGTAQGLAFSGDGGASWRIHHAGGGLPTDDIVAVATKGQDIWAQCIEVVGEDGELYGRGLARWDAANGRWAVYGRAQGIPTDGFREFAWDVLVDEDGIIWLALWYGGLARSDDDGATWKLIIPKDRQGRDIKHFYSLAKDGDIIWAACQVDAAQAEKVFGVVKSEDNGAHWTYYGQNEGVDGFCVAVNIQPDIFPPAVWVATSAPDYATPGNGVFKTDTGGATWFHYTTAEGLGSNTVYGLASAAEWAWVGTVRMDVNDDGGVSRTDDGGSTWENATTADGLPSNDISCLAANSPTDLWAGTFSNGLAVSVDAGATWRPVDLSSKTKPLNLPDAFAFPNPFDLTSDVTLTFRYALAAPATVTLDVYDFGGRLVKRVVDSQFRAAGERVDETWDGRREDGGRAANGVYFFVIKVENAVAATGKFVILD